MGQQQIYLVKLYCRLFSNKLNNSIYQLIMILWLLLLLQPILSIISTPYWTSTPHIQTFTYLYTSTLYAGSSSPALLYATYTNRTYTTTPAAFAVVSSFALNTNNYGDYYYHDVAIGSKSTTSLTVTVSVTYGIAYLQINIMLYDQTFLSMIQHNIYGTQAITTIMPNANYSYQFAINTIDPNNNILIIPYLVRIYQYASYFGIKTYTKLINATYFQLIYNFNGVATSATGGGIIFRSVVMVIDVTLFQRTRTFYIDHYVLPEAVSISTLWTGQLNSFQSSVYINSSCNNKIFGYSGMRTTTSTYVYPDFRFTCAVLQIPSNTYLIDIGYTVTNFRVRVCDFGTPYYHEFNNTCLQKCPIKFYGVPQYLYCMNCPYNCLTCNDTGDQCLSCSTGDFRIMVNKTMINGSIAGSCECKIGYFDTRLSVSMCSPCHYTCQTCIEIWTKCLTCNLYRQLKIINNSCPCLTGFQDSGSNPNCSQICGDGIKILVACDDGNNIPNDGCSSTCTIETNYQCQELNSTSKSICSYNKPLLFTVTSLLINNSTFTITATVSVSPSLPWMTTYNFSKLITNNSNVSIVSSTYGAGNINFLMKYSQSAAGETVNFTFTTPNTSNTFALPNSSFSFSIPPLIEPVQPTQVPAYLSTVTKLLYIFTGINLLIYIVGGLKLAYVETMWTLQISYFCLLGSVYIQPLQKVFSVINIAANGYNRVIWGQINVNSFSIYLSQFLYNDQFLANFNVMLIIQLVLIVLSVIFFGIAKIKAIKEVRHALMSIHSFLLYDATFSFVLFNILNSSFAMGIQIIVFLEKGFQPHSYQNIIGMFLSFGITITSFCLFIFRNNQFTNNVGMFKHDKQSKYFPLIMLGVRFTMGLIMGILFHHWYSGLIVLALQMGYGIYISVKNPYTFVFLLRAILNETTILQNLLVGFLYQIARINETDKGGLVPLWIQTFLLGVTSLSSLFYMSYTIYMKIKTSIKNSNKIEIEDDYRSPRQSKGKRQKRVVDLDHNNTLQNLAQNKLQGSGIGFYEGRSSKKRMKGEDY